MQMYTEARVGSFLGSFDELKKVSGRYSPHFMEFPIGFSHVQKLGIEVERNNNQYLVMVSVSHPSLIALNGYNLILTVMGQRQEDAKAIMGDLESRLGIELREAPQQLKKTFQAIQLMIAKSS
jgi:hypothetical protein